MSKHSVSQFLANQPQQRYARRAHCLLVIIALVGLIVLLRTLQLQVLDNDYYVKEGNERYLRTVEVAAHRGVIADRNGEPLAISTPVESAWVNPQVMLKADISPGKIQQLARLLEITPVQMLEQIKTNANKEFVYLKRQLNPKTVLEISQLKVPGIYFKREYRRYYPSAEVFAHVIGFTNIDDKGVEGLELALNKTLTGKNGKQRVVKDNLGQAVEQIESIQAPQPGEDLVLSLDRHIQYLAYKELKTAVSAHGAQSGSAVVMDVLTGEVLAMVNQPAFNPNEKAKLPVKYYRNRAVTDLFEPGSVVKPFIVATALQNGRYSRETIIDTTPGYIQVGAKRIYDLHNYGKIDLSLLLQKSSNVGATKLALEIPPQQYWQLLSALGLGQSTHSGFPGEATGRLRHFSQWSQIDRATLAYGYGLSVTVLQLAQAYGVLANGGIFVPATFTKINQPAPKQRVMLPVIARQVNNMLETVVHPGGTGILAEVAGYRIAGKTGTVHKMTAQGYADDQYLSVFAGFAPASKPRLAVVVTIDNPSKGGYLGGTVAAPVFSNIMAGALRQLNIAPDALQNQPLKLAGQAQP